MQTYSHCLKNHTAITIAGPSQCGKSTLVEQMVVNKDVLFEDEFSKVFWFCAYPPEKKVNEVIYKIGSPSNILDSIVPNSLVIIDDYMSELRNSNELTNIMTKAVHHLPMTLIYITQNIFNKGSETKTRRLNTNYVILFKNPHDKAQIEYIGRQMFPRDKNFLCSAFDHVTKQQPYSYLLIDCHQTTRDEIRVRSDILNKQMITVYKPPSISLSI